MIYFLLNSDTSTYKKYKNITDTNNYLYKMYNDVLKKKKEDLITDAVERGILERAGENARLLIGGFLENVRGEPVTFVTSDGGRL